MKASEIAKLVGGTLEGGADPDITGVAPLERAGPKELSFLAHPRYASYLERSAAGAVLVAEALADRADGPRVRIVVNDVHRALATVLFRLYPEPELEPGIHPTAVVDGEAVLGQDVVVGPYAVIGRGARIGDRVRIGAHVVVGERCTVGDDVVLHPHVTLYPGVRVGPRSILHSGVRAGVDGFGYVPWDGANRKVPQVGECVIGADVEIGANTTIDRGAMEDTVIEDGVKLDNQIQIGHNVRIGAHTAMAACVGVSGSATIGRRCMIGGATGIAGHISICDDVAITGMSTITHSITRPGVYSGGIPAEDARTWRRMVGRFKRLDALAARVTALERAVRGAAGDSTDNELEDKNDD